MTAARHLRRQVCSRRQVATVPDTIRPAASKVLERANPVAGTSSVCSKSLKHLKLGSKSSNASIRSVSVRISRKVQVLVISYPCMSATRYERNGFMYTD